MADSESSLYNDLARQDDVGLVLRGHLHIERELVHLVSAFLPFHARCDWSKLSYRAKVELAHACGLPLDVKNLLEKVGTLRNDFAHKLSAFISKESALDLYNSLSPRHRAGLKDSYKVMFGKALSKPAALPPHDLLTLVLLTAHSATLAAALALPTSH